MARILITGAGGFIGSHLSEYMIKKGHDVYGTSFASDGTRNLEGFKDKLTVLKWDMNSKERTEEIVKKAKPDFVYHLAAQSFVVPSWEDPEGTIKTNVLGTLYLLDAVRKFSPEAVICVACSSAEYGSVNEKDIPINEFQPFKPSSPYAVSKVGQDMLSYLYARAYGMKIIRIRFFNITGPRKTFDACSDFSRGIAEVELGLKEKLTVGNLGGVRDFTDVRDVVKAIDLLSKKGKHGEVYNVCSGNAYKVGDLLSTLINMSSKQITPIIAPDTRRKIDDPIFVGDNTKIKSLGWHPEIKIEETLSDMLEYWRNVLK